MTLRYLRLFLHTQYSHILIQLYHTSTLQLLYRGLLMAHNAAGSFLFGKVNKFLKAKEQQVVCCYHQHIIIDIQFIHCKQKVTYSAQSCIVRFSTIVNNGDGFGIMLISCPLLKDGGKLMVRNNYVFIYFWYPVNVIEHTTKNSILSNLQKWFRKVLCQLS